MLSSPKCSAMIRPSASVMARSRAPNRVVTPAFCNLCKAGEIKSGPSPSRATSSAPAPGRPSRRSTTPSRAEEASCPGVFSAATVSGSISARYSAGCAAMASATGRSPIGKARRSSAAKAEALKPGGRLAGSRQASGLAAMRRALPSARSYTGRPSGSASTQPSRAPISARKRSAARLAPISA